jgi:hypothetical protein
MSVPPGWSHDPFGRYAQRYWDGSSWTNQVKIADGSSAIDPMGSSLAIPFATPITAVGEVKAGWWKRLRNRFRRR